MHEMLMQGDAFCVNILPEHRRDWSDWWAGKAPKGGDQFADIPHSTKATGSPVLDECVGYIDCKVWARYEAGDHTLFLGEVQEASVHDNPDVRPLLFFASKYRNLADGTCKRLRHEASRTRNAACLSSPKSMKPSRRACAVLPSANCAGGRASWTMPLQARHGLGFPP